ncbi:MAG TPA: hypothetical protein VLG50_05225 [Candidatus Saccharimonadales bacterium]|nr:hypothetical protein [Candidatus Saccharimonadales bacterium]
MDSPDDCIICFDKIDENHAYITIDNPGETGKYHLHCIESWMIKSKNGNNGLLVQNPIDSMVVHYDNQHVILNIPQKPTKVEEENPDFNLDNYFDDEDDPCYTFCCF